MALKDLKGKLQQATPVGEPDLSQTGLTTVRGSSGLTRPGSAGNPLLDRLRTSPGTDTARQELLSRAAQLRAQAEEQAATEAFAKAMAEVRRATALVLVIGFDLTASTIGIIDELLRDARVLEENLRREFGSISVIPMATRGGAWDGNDVLIGNAGELATFRPENVANNGGSHFGLLLEVAAKRILKGKVGRSNTVIGAIVIGDDRFIQRETYVSETVPFLQNAKIAVGGIVEPICGNEAIVDTYRQAIVESFGADGVVVNRSTPGAQTITAVDLITQFLINRANANPALIAAAQEKLRSRTPKALLTVKPFTLAEQLQAIGHGAVVPSITQGKPRQIGTNK